MRTNTITINGKEYLLCFSVRVIRDCTERYGDMGKIGEALSDKDPVKGLDEAIWLLQRMMDAGSRYAKIEGLENPEPLSCDGLYDCCGLDEYVPLKSKVMETIVGGQKAGIEVEPSKNAKATPGKG